MVNYACRRLRWPSGCQRLINASATTGRSPVPSMSSISSHFVTRQFGAPTSFSNMTKFFGTSSCNALSFVIFPPLRATRQLGRTQYLSTTPTKLRSSTAFPPSGYSLPVSKHHTSHYQRGNTEYCDTNPTLFTLFRSNALVSLQTFRSCGEPSNAKLFDRIGDNTSTNSVNTTNGMSHPVR